VIDRTGFKFDATGAASTPAMTERERTALRELDPEREFEAEVSI
jgi:glutaconate CoA-transferase subunit B